MGTLDEKEALAMGYSLLNASLGYAVAAAVVPGCVQKQEHVDWLVHYCKVVWNWPSFGVGRYFFGHGADYTAALQDYALLGGQVPIPQRSFLGMSWSKWLTAANQVSMVRCGSWSDVTAGATGATWLLVAGAVVSLHLQATGQHCTVHCRATPMISYTS